MIELGKKYQTRDGRAVRILAMDMKGIFSVAGIITEMDGSQHIYSWKANGESDMNAANVAWNRNSDLIPVLTKHEGWIVLFCGEGDDVFSTERAALNWLCNDTRVGRVAHVTWED